MTGLRLMEVCSASTQFGSHICSNISGRNSKTRKLFSFNLICKLRSYRIKQRLWESSVICTPPPEPQHVKSTHCGKSGFICST